jgi:hypothetical protein
MKKVLFLGVSLTILATLAGFGFENKSREAPPGVDPQFWVSVADNFGIVLEDATGFSSIAGVKGTLMVRVGRNWRPLYLTPNVVPHLQPAQQ